MRRKPYAELVAEATPAGRMPVEAPLSPVRDTHIVASRVIPLLESAPTPLHAELKAAYTAEIAKLAAIVGQYRRTASAEEQKMCAFVDEKLQDASNSVESGNGDGAWIHLFGAAKLCRSFEIQSQEAARIIHRLEMMIAQNGSGGR